MLLRSFVLSIAFLGVSLSAQEASEPPVKITKESHPFLWVVIHRRVDPVPVQTRATGDFVCALVRPPRPFMEQVGISTWRFNLREQ
jgi:hypothetical protein